jgi:hypothetical protein
MTARHLAIGTVVFVMWQSGCAGKPPRESLGAPSASAPLRIELTVTGVNEVCSARVYGEEHGCVYAWGTGTHFDDSILNSDGCVRVGCGELGEVCGIAVACKCVQGRPRSSRECR